MGSVSTRSDWRLPSLSQQLCTGRCNCPRSQVRGLRHKEVTQLMSSSAGTRALEAQRQWLRCCCRRGGRGQARLGGGAGGLGGPRGPCTSRAASAPCGWSGPRPQSCPSLSISTSALLGQSALFLAFPHFHRLVCCFRVRTRLGGACCLHPRCTDSFPSCFWKAVLSLPPTSLPGTWVVLGSARGLGARGCPCPWVSLRGSTRAKLGDGVVRAPGPPPALPAWTLLPSI